MTQRQRRRPRRLGRQAFLAGSLVRRIRVAQRVRIVCLSTIGGILEKPPRRKSCACLGHLSQDCPNNGGDNPKGKGKAKRKGDGKGKDTSEDVPQSQSAPSSSGTPQPTIVAQTAARPSSIADLSSALTSEAKIHMKVLEVEDPGEAKDLVALWIPKPRPVKHPKRG